MKRLPGSFLRTDEFEGSVSIMLRSGKNLTRITTLIEKCEWSRTHTSDYKPVKFSNGKIFLYVVTERSVQR